MIAVFWRSDFRWFDFAVIFWHSDFRWFGLIGLLAFRFQMVRLYCSLLAFRFMIRLYCSLFAFSLQMVRLNSTPNIVTWNGEARDSFVPLGSLVFQLFLLRLTATTFLSLCCWTCLFTDIFSSGVEYFDTDPLNSEEDYQYQHLGTDESDCRGDSLS